MKKINSTQINEAMMRFLENGGKITILAPHNHQAKPKRVHVRKQETQKEEINTNALPKALKIRFGIK